MRIIMSLKAEFICKAPVFFLFPGIIVIHHDASGEAEEEDAAGSQQTMYVCSLIHFHVFTESLLKFTVKILIHPFQTRPIRKLKLRNRQKKNK